MPPASSLGDSTTHGGSVVGGSSNVLIGKKPAARMGDQCICPLADPKPHVGGPITKGSSTVLINGMPAARQGDIVSEATSVSNIAIGDSTVLIGG